MQRVPFTRFFMIILIGVLTLTPATAAWATPPTFETIPLAGTFDFAAGEPCDFPVHGEVTGELNLQHHYDRAGNLIFDQITFVQWSIRVTNVETGVAVFSAGPAPFKVMFNADGSLTFAHTGLNVHLVVPGQGLVAANVGRIVIELTFEDGVEHSEVIFEAGQHDGDLGPEVCAALAR